MTDEQDPVTGQAGTRTTTTRHSLTLTRRSACRLWPGWSPRRSFAGAFWFGLLSLAAAIAYAPAGVRPREIGLNSGTVLTQSAVGLVSWFIVLAVFLLIYVAVFWIYFLFRRGQVKRALAKEDNPAAREFHRLRIENLERLARRYAVRALLGTGLIVFVSAAYLVIQDALDARDALKDGQRARDGGGRRACFFHAEISAAVRRRSLGQRWNLAYTRRCNTHA